ncbi:MAG: hypothetical protein ACFFDN_35895 [Candidatus Hodarchaeota archaeon]
MSSGKYTFGDISDDIRTKKFIPLGRNIWKFYKEFGWEVLDENQNLFADIIYELSDVRLNESIMTTRAVNSGEIKEPEKTLCYAASPPVLSVRTDLQTGMIIMMFGTSVDLPFVIVDDTTQEVLFVLSVHLEDGVPVDWWLVKRDGELLKRRHQRYGYKLKEMVKRCKTITDSGDKFLQIFRDIRNERTPQWNQSRFHLAIIWASSVLNLLMESSNYESIGQMYDGLAAKLFYGLGDYSFIFHPFPAMMNTFVYAGRTKFISRIAGLSTGRNLYLQPVEERAWKIIRETIPLTLEYIENKYKNEGIPTPIQTLNCKVPKWKNKKIWKDDSKLELEYPKGDRIHAEDLGLSVEECIKGVYLEFGEEDTEKITPDKIVSIGIGRYTEFLK